MDWKDVGLRAGARSKSEPANEVEWWLLVDVFDCGCISGSSVSLLGRMAPQLYIQSSNRLLNHSSSSTTSPASFDLSFA